MDPGYDASGGIRKSREMTAMPAFARFSWIFSSVILLSRHHAPPCNDTISGNGPSPRGLKVRAMSGLSPCLRYSTSWTSN